MAIQVRRTGADDFGRWMKLLICGKPGAGKTLLSSTFPNALFASAEGGMMSVWDRNLMTVDITNTSQLMEVHRLLDQTPEVREKMIGAPVDTVVIDTLDEIAKILQKERNLANRRETFQRDDWGWFGDQMRGVLRVFRNLPMHVIFTCHIQDGEDSETGAVMVKPAIQGAVGGEVAQFVDLALLLQSRSIAENVDGEVRRSLFRYLQTYPDTRHDWIKDRSGRLPMEFPVNFEDDYKRLDALIYGNRPEVEEAPRTPIQIEVPTQETAPVAEPQPQPEPVPERPTAPVEAVVPTDPSPEPSQVTDEEAVAAGKTKEDLAEPATPDSAPAAEESVSTSDTSAEGDLQCSGCGGAIETLDQRDLSRIRFRKDLCRKCFVAEKDAKGRR